MSYLSEPVLFFVLIGRYKEWKRWTLCLKLDTKLLKIFLNNTNT